MAHSENQPKENQDQSKRNNRRLKRRKRRKRRLLIVGVLLLLVLGVRIWLPYYIKNTLVASINELEDYSCKLDDVDLAIYRGGMVLEGLEIFITENEVREPFVVVPVADISVAWAEVFNGALVGEIVVERPQLYFSDGASDKDDQVGGTSWTQPIIDFIPLEINEFVINDGVAEFENRDANFDTKVNLHHINLVVTNLRNTIEDNDSLPSKITMTSKIYKQGDFTVNGRLNILKDLPNMDLDLKATQIDLRQLNPLWETYAKLDFESGSFGFASEYAMREGKINGYLKPILDDVSVFSFKEEGTFLNKSWEALAGLAFEITENQRHNRTATKVPFEGTYEEVNVHVLATVLNIFRNALFKAYEVEIDNSVSFEGFRNNTDASKLTQKIKDAFKKE